MSSLIDNYNTRAQDFTSDSSELVNINVPDYIYALIEETAQRDNINKTAALIKLMRSGDVVNYVTNNGGKIIVEDSEGEKTYINFN